VPRNCSFSITTRAADDLPTISCQLTIPAVMSAIAVLLLISSALISHVIGHEEGTCSARTQSCSAESHHADDMPDFLSVIRAAEQSFTDLTVGQECFESQIDRDLSPWSQTGISRNAVNSAKSHGILYQVIDGHVFREEKCLFPARCEGVDFFLKKICGNISDTEFVVNFHDYPQISNHFGTRKDPPPPVFSFSKSRDAYRDILYPAWSFHSGGPAIDLYPRGIGDWDKFRESITRSSGDWSSKRDQAFFRGSRTSSERDGLILLSRSNSHVIDAQYTKNQAWRSLADTLGMEPAGTISFESQCKYKYLLNMKGVAASFRYKHLFLCKSLVLNVDSEWIEFFYPFLQPWIHFVPVNTDFSDLIIKLQFLRDNDQIAERIADRGFQFIWNHLTTESIECYWRRLLTHYTNLLNYNISPDESLTRIS
jgi:protein glucosyltransferase